MQRKPYKKVANTKLQVDIIDKITKAIDLAIKIRSVPKHILDLSARLYRGYYDY